MKIINFVRSSEKLMFLNSGTAAAAAGSEMEFKNKMIAGICVTFGRVRDGFGLGIPDIIGVGI